MKKRMFLTTAIVVLLLLVALSTATFAWFSASNVVNVSVISFTASSNGESGGSAGGNTGGDLLISWTEEASESYEISFARNEDMRPMIPKRGPMIGQSYESFIAIISDENTESNFHSAVQAYNEEGGYQYYAGAFRSEIPTKCKSADGVETFYLINKNTEFAQRVTVKYEIEGHNAKALCVALFADDVLVGIMGENEKLYYGEMTVGGRVDEQDYTEIIAKSGEITFNIAKDSAKKMRLVAWYSGVDLDDDMAEKDAMLTSLKFVGDYAG